MIRPDKHTNLDLSLMNISSFILNRLLSSTDIGYDALKDMIISEMGEKCIVNYPYALNFLFLLGKIDYLQESDTFRINEA